MRVLGLSRQSSSADTWNMTEQRQHTRLLCAAFVRLQIHHQRLHAELVNLEDISRTGASIQTEHPLQLNTPVVLHYRDGELPGIVRHCSGSEKQYFSGIEFTYGCEWVPEFFRARAPAESHLTLKWQGHKSQVFSPTLSTSTRLTFDSGSAPEMRCTW